MMRGIVPVACLLLAGLAGGQTPAPKKPAVPAHAGRAGARTSILDRLEKMSPEDRKTVLDKLPEARRKKLEVQLAKYDSMTPEERKRARQRLAWFRKLSPERQEATRQLYRRFSQLPEQRRRAIRHGVWEISKLDEAGRNARMESSDFRARYSSEELQMVHDLYEATPRP